MGCRIGGRGGEVDDERDSSKDFLIGGSMRGGSMEGSVAMVEKEPRGLAGGAPSNPPPPELRLVAYCCARAETTAAESPLPIESL